MCEQKYLRFGRERERKTDEAFATVVGCQDEEKEGRERAGRRSVPTLARPPGGGENYPAAVPRPLYLVCSLEWLRFFLSFFLKTK